MPLEPAVPLAARYRAGCFACLVPKVGSSEARLLKTALEGWLLLITTSLTGNASTGEVQLWDIRRWDSRCVATIYLSWLHRANLAGSLALHPLVPRAAPRPQLCRLEQRATVSTCQCRSLADSCTRVVGPVRPSCQMLGPRGAAQKRASAGARLLCRLLLCTSFRRLKRVSGAGQFKTSTCQQTARHCWSRTLAAGSSCYDLARVLCGGGPSASRDLQQGCVAAIPAAIAGASP